MKKLEISISIILIILVVSLSVASIKLISSFQAKEQVNKEYSYTTAICDETNFCQDHIIICNDKEIISVSPIQGAFIQFSKNWKDPRDEKTKEFCE